jgi:hypothetical protein
MRARLTVDSRCAFTWCRSFPVFLRARPELTWDDVCKNAKTKTPFSQIKKIIPALKKQHSILFSTVPSRDQGSGTKLFCFDYAVGSPPLGCSNKRSFVCWRPLLLLLCL